MTQTFVEFLIEGSKPRGGSWVAIKKKHINDFVERFGDSDADGGDGGYWGQEIKRDNEFVVMNEPADDDHIWIDKDGDEMEVPVTWVKKVGGPNNTMRGTGRMGSMRENAKPKARWQLTSGPNRVRGYELQIPSKSGGYTGVGFKMATDKPKTTGPMKLYVGATGKDVNVELDDYNFITEAVEYPSPAAVEDYVNNNYYVYDEDHGQITIEDTTASTKESMGWRVKFMIDFGPGTGGGNHVSVRALDFADEEEVQKHENIIYRDIIDNA